jgi:hypothetical protein
VIITTYNQHVGSFLPSLGLLSNLSLLGMIEPTSSWNHSASCGFENKTDSEAREAGGINSSPAFPNHVSRH